MKEKRATRQRDPPVQDVSEDREPHIVGSLEDTTLSSKQGVTSS